MVKISVDISNKELNAMENIIMCWNLCNKHKKIFNASDNECWKFTQTGKKCIKINKELHNKALHLWSKLVTAYLKVAKLN